MSITFLKNRNLHVLSKFRQIQYTPIHYEYLVQQLRGIIMLTLR